MPHIGTRTLAHLLRRVAMALRAGVDARTIWTKESQQGTPVHRGQVAQVRDRLLAGDSLAEALAGCRGYFPTLACDLVEVGERTGRLDEVLTLLAEHYEHLLELRRTFLIGIAWPAIQLFAAIMIIGLLIWVSGALGGMSAGGKPLDLLGFGLVGTGGLIKYLVGVGLLAGGVTWLVLALLRGYLGTRPLQWVMQVPVIGGCLKTSALSRFAWTLSLTLDAGLDALRALRLSLRSTQNVYYTSHGEAAERVISAGGEFHEALRATGVFPEDFLTSLETAEVAGTPGETLQRLATEYRERAKTAARILAVAAAFATWIAVAGLLIWLIFRIFFISYLGPMQELQRELRLH